jgi:anti-sigma factor ChrR (cupin superfamily)
MSSSSDNQRCEHRDLVASYALAALERDEAESMKAHLPTCAECQQEYQALSTVTDTLSAWRHQTLPPLASSWNRLAERISTQPQKQAVAPPIAAPSSPLKNWDEPRWKEVAPGISCKLLSTDREMDRVSMMVRLAPNTAYPPHRHAGVEELYLLEGELWIENRKLEPGDFNRAGAGTADQRVWSETGCMCLLITSPSDQLG